jgi:hypothetical protein
MDAPDTTQDAYRSKFLLNKEFDDFFLLLNQILCFFFCKVTSIQLKWKNI